MMEVSSHTVTATENAAVIADMKQELAALRAEVAKLRDQAVVREG
jgi:cell division protein FtsB